MKPIRQHQTRLKRSLAGNASTKSIQKNLLDWVVGAGDILRGYFGKITNPRRKEDASSVVCDADLASEKYILEQLRAEFPDHNIIAEESGLVWKDAEYTWVIDPLDGTSNFVAGIPWFGVMIGVLRDSKPVLGAMYLPIEKTLYFAEAGQGAYRNRDRVQVTSETDLQNLLCAFGFDPTPDLSSRKNVEMLFRVSGAFRNVRTTNSLVDFCYTTDGRFGGCINLKTKIWDIAAASIILPEAGGKLTYVDGRELAFELDEQIIQKEFAVLGASIELHPKLVALARAKGK